MAAIERFRYLKEAMALTEAHGKLDDGLPGYVEFNGELDNPKQGGFMVSVERAADAGIKGAGQAAADFIPGIDQDNALKKYGERYRCQSQLIWTYA